VVRGYFNNHYGAKAVVNAIEFKEILGERLSQGDKQFLYNARNLFSEPSRQATLDSSLNTGKKN
jgi:hypothetical protein